MIWSWSRSLPVLPASAAPPALRTGAGISVRTRTSDQSTTDKGGPSAEQYVGAILHRDQGLDQFRCLLGQDLRVRKIRAQLGTAYKFGAHHVADRLLVADTACRGEWQIARDLSLRGYWRKLHTGEQPMRLNREISESVPSTAVRVCEWRRLSAAAPRDRRHTRSPSWRRPSRSGNL
jgi:hypothetical protein